VTEPSKSIQAPTPPEPPLDKEVVRLPDGRELTYYRFPEPSRGSPGEAQGNRGSPARKER
jgi:hypothetical protein